jgi:hypothetical protein
MNVLTNEHSHGDTACEMCPCVVVGDDLAALLVCSHTLFVCLTSFDISLPVLLVNQSIGSCKRHCKTVCPLEKVKVSVQIEASN